MRSTTLALCSLSLLSLTSTILTAIIKGPMTPHFVNFLKQHDNYYAGIIDSVTRNGPTGSFGGKAEDHEIRGKTPVLFIHGNSDSALKFGTEPSTTGWSKSVEFFGVHGWSTMSLYGITYGDRNISHSFDRHIDCDILVNHRRLLEAVLEYTDSPKISIIAHSMGVSIARNIIGGGQKRIGYEECDLGKSLVDRVDVLLALAGANAGMCVCIQYSSAGACNSEYGFYPGTCTAHEDTECSSLSTPCDNFSTAAAPLITGDKERKDANVVISFWSEDDEVLGKDNIVWGRHTSLVPQSDFTKVFKSLKHMQVKDQTLVFQLDAIRDHKV